jgi:hypothetical protein
MCWYKQVSATKEGQYIKNAMKKCLVLELEEIMWESDYAVINEGYRYIYVFVSLKYLPSFTFHSAGGKIFQSTFVSWQWTDFVSAPCTSQNKFQNRTLPIKNSVFLILNSPNYYPTYFIKNTSCLLSLLQQETCSSKFILISIYCWYQRKWSTRKLTSKLLRQFVQTSFLILISTAKNRLYHTVYHITIREVCYVGLLYMDCYHVSRMCVTETTKCREKWLGVSRTQVNNIPDEVGCTFMLGLVLDSQPWWGYGLTSLGRCVCVVHIQVRSWRQEGKRTTLSMKGTDMFKTKILTPFKFIPIH